MGGKKLWYNGTASTLDIHMGVHTDWVYMYMCILHNFYFKYILNALHMFYTFIYIKFYIPCK